MRDDLQQLSPGSSASSTHGFTIGVIHQKAVTGSALDSPYLDERWIGGLRMASDERYASIIHHDAELSPGRSWVRR